MLGLAQHTDMLEHGGMCERTPYIVADQMYIEETILGRLEVLDLLVHAIALLPDLCHDTYTSCRAMPGSRVRCVIGPQEEVLWRVPPGKTPVTIPLTICMTPSMKGILEGIEAIKKPSPLPFTS